MARKPPDWRQPSLFPPDPAKPTEPHDNATPKSQGDRHAVQDDHSRTPTTTHGDSRPAGQGTEAAPDGGTLRPGAEGKPRSLEGAPPGADAGQRPGPDRERSPG